MKEEGSSTEFRNCVSKKGDVIIARVSAIKSVLSVEKFAITSILKGNCCRIFWEKSLSGDGLNGGQGYLTEIFAPELFF